MLGSSVKIQCVSHSDVVWTLNGEALKNLSISKLKENVYVLVVSLLKNDDVGLYTCYGRDDKDDKYTSFYSIAEIYIQGCYENSRSEMNIYIYIFSK